MGNILTDDMVQKAVEHINNRAPSYGPFYESHLARSPYDRAAFASAIKELYNIEICEDMVPSLEQIDNARGKNELYVIHEQDYDLFWINAILTKDKFDKYTERFGEIHLKDYQNPEKVKSIKKLEHLKNEILWEIEFTDEYLQKVYEGYLRQNTLDDLKKNRSHLTHVGFNYDLLKINEYYDTLHEKVCTL